LPSNGDKVERFLSYAEELRSMAERMMNPEARAIVLSVAEDYERLAGQLRAQDEAGEASEEIKRQRGAR
jgi:hypothetical protein